MRTLLPPLEAQIRRMPPAAPVLFWVSKTAKIKSSKFGIKFQIRRFVGSLNIVHKKYGRKWQGIFMEE